MADFKIQSKSAVERHCGGSDREVKNWYLLMSRLRNRCVSCLLLTLAFAGCQSDNHNARRRHAVHRPTPTRQLAQVPTPTPDYAVPELPPLQPFAVSDDIPTLPAVADDSIEFEQPLPPADSLTATQPDEQPEAESESTTASLPALASEASIYLQDMGAVLTRDADDRVQKIDLAYRPFHDGHSSLLQFFADTTELDLTGTDITDAAVSDILKLPKVYSLKLKGTAITDAGVAQLVGLTSLRLVDLGRTALTNDALRQLQSLQHLEYLLLNHTQVSDEAVEHIVRMKSLRGLNLVGTAVTSRSLERLQKQLPQCLVVSEPSSNLSLLDVPAEFQQPASVGRSASAEHAKLQRLTRLVHEDPSLAEHLASVYSDQGEWSQAAAIFRAATDVRPRDESLQLLLAEALASAGQAEEAYALFCNFADESTARLEVGRILYNSALSQATRYLEQSIAANPNNGQARQGLVELQEHRRELMAGRSVLPAVLAIEPTPQITPRTAFEFAPAPKSQH
ncbi:hypothetical protein [Fuerstiella marisgermanici]|uniref:Putative PEP-CTERM system TPR-repeat lipoprotein n=1 Tax=Fuerstiella marisgermanici TaxID=1891926 RepID=A0A1P8WC51_9PLAN|nr:hypothetical protein [Fuerstiella marisgermanici]APZ91637.1 putative PEP-CTERM system TPR-repeat lipoprotein [Fuerstiella marisgermanici]